MISYDQYENKIKKYAKFKNFMKRFKFLFIGIFALIIATIATLLAVKGSFSGAIKIADSVYGNPYDDPEGVSAFMSSVSYEYAREGSGEWSDQKPVKAGTYSVRAVSDKTIGKGYGKVTSFTIEPREAEFTIGSDSVVYGSVPNNISLNLLPGDMYDRNALLFVYDDYAAQTTNVDLDGSSVKILNGTDDRSSCYVVKHEKKELKIEPRKINVSLDKVDFVYSGYEISYPAEASSDTKLQLANGDVIEFDKDEQVAIQQNGVAIEAIFAGNYSALAGDFKVYKAIDGEKIDVTAQYLPNKEPVGFTIERKPFTLQTSSAEKEYDGKLLSKADGYSVAGLIKGDELIVLGSSSIVNAGSRDNQLDYAIQNQDGVDLTDNYAVNWQCGQLTVSPRKITVTSPSTAAPLVYDGERHSITEIDCTDTLFKVKARSSKSVITVGTYQNEVEFDILNSAGNREDKSNFAITAKWGTLEIIRREIIVTIKNVKKIYDGKPLYALPQNDEVLVIAGSFAVSDAFSNDTAGLKFITDAATDVPNQSEYKIFCGSEDRTKNYKITYNRGTLTVDPVHIALHTRSEQFVYNGELHSAADNAEVVVDGRKETLIEGNVLTVISYTELRNVSKAENHCEYSVNTKNYIIDKVIPGTIEVIPRTLIVETNSNSFVYDGTAHSDVRYDTIHITENGLREAGLLGGDKLTLREGSVPTVTDVSAVENECEFTVPNNNYQIVGYVYGTLQVTPRLITVVTESAVKVYDGTPLLNDQYKTYYDNKKESGLIGNDKLNLLVRFEITNVDSSGENRCEFTVPNNNYQILNYEYGTLTIMPRLITVVTESAKKVYDGTPLSNDNYNTYYVSKKVNGLLGGDKLNLQSLCEITNVKDSGKNECEFAVPNNNYQILGYEYGTLTITPKPVVIEALTATSVYGENYKEAQYPTEAGNYKSEDGFIGEHETAKLTVEFDLSEYKSEIKDMSRVPVKWVDGKIAGYENAVKIVGWEFIGGDKRNYDVKTENGTLYIARRVLTVWMKDATTFYGEDIYNEDGSSAVYPAGKGNVDGVYLHEEYADSNDSVNSNSKIATGLLEGDEIEIKAINYLNLPSDSDSDEEDWETAYITPKSAGSYYIKPYEIWIYSSGGETEITMDRDDDESEGNYLVQYYVPGTLKIKPRPIEITLNEIEGGIYDGAVRTYGAGEENITLALDKVNAGETAYLKKRDMALAYEEQLNVKVIFENIPDFLPKYAGVYSYAFDEKNSVIVNKDKTESDLSNYLIVCKDEMLTIEKRPVTIRLHDLNIVYGDEAKYPDNNFYDITSELGFIAGDSIGSVFIDFVGYEYGKSNVGKYTITVLGVIIKNEDGLELDGYNSVTNSYDIEWIDAKLTVEKKQVSVTVYSATLKYGDEIILPQPTISLSELPYNEQLTFGFAYLQNGELTTPRNVGKYDIKAIPLIDGSEEGTKNYDIAYLDEGGNPLSNATLTDGLVIEKLEIDFTVEDQRSTYGDKLEDIKITHNPIPYEDERLTFTGVYQKQDGTVTTPKYADKYVIKVEKLFINGNVVFINGGEEIDCNYIFSCNGDGILTIDRRAITVALNSLTVTYGEPVEYREGANGLYKTNYTLIKGSLVQEDSLGVVFDFGWEETGKMRPDAGTYTISKSGYLITVSDGDHQSTHQDGYLVADSYDIEWVDGDLTVEKREINVTLKTIPDDFYNGRVHDYIDAEGEELIGGMGMATGEKLDVKVIYYSVTDGGRGGTVEAIGKAGLYEYELDLLHSAIVGGNERLENYEISSERRTCRIQKRSIEVELLNIDDIVYGTSIVYPDGFGNYNNITAIEPVNGGLVDGEKLEIFVKFRTADGKVNNIDNGMRLPAGEYEVYGVGASVEGDGGFSDSNNYEIKFVNGKFKVGQKQITVALKDLTVDYGERIEYKIEAGNYKEIGGNGLAENETLTVTEVRFVNLPENAPVGTYLIQIVFFIVRNADGLEMTENYELTGARDGLLTIEKRRILVTTASHGFVYDGDAHDTRELSDSYKIEYVKDATKGLAYSDVSAYADEATLPSVIEYRADKVTNEFEIVIKRDGKDISRNYDISYLYGELSVLKRKLYVTTMGAEKVYDGKPLILPDEIQECYSYLNNDPLQGKTEGLVMGHVFTFKSEVVTITEVGSVKNDTVNDIVESKTSSVSKMLNYEIVESKLGTLTVKERKIYVDWSYNGKDVYDEWVYDGLTHYSPDGGIYTVSFYDDEENIWKTGEENVLVKGHTFMTKAVSLTDAGELANNPYIGVKEGGNDVSRNYGIISRSGKLVINKRPVSVSTNDHQMTYSKRGPQIDKADLIRYVQYEGEEAGRGILNSEKLQIEINVVYWKNGGKITRFDAGEYQIKLKFLNDGDNYEYEYVDTGLLTIDRVQLTLQPKSKTELYGTVDHIETTEEEIEIIRLLEDGTTSNSLITGDRLVSVALNRTTLLASANKSYLSVKIVKDSVILRDTAGVDTTDNYNITLNMGSLEFMKRVIYFKQYVPENIKNSETGRGEVSYTGAKQTIDPYNNESLFERLGYSDALAAGYEGDENEYGLAAEDETLLKSASVGKQPGIYDQWVTLNVVNGEALRTKHYEIRLTMHFGDTSIEVKHVQVSVKDFRLSSDLTTAIQNNTLAEGITLLDSETDFEAEVNSEEDFWTNAGYSYEMALYRKGNTYAVYVFIYELRESGNKTDRSSIFAVSGESGIEGLDFMLVGMENYPTGV